LVRFLRLRHGRNVSVKSTTILTGAHRGHEENAKLFGDLL
jgi:hypothetical protein